MADIKGAKACAAGQDEVKAGGWTPVNPTDRQVIEIGKFAVDAYNHKHQQQKLAEPNDGGWTPVNPTDPQVIKIGKFAVDAYNNKHQHHKLVFETVEMGWSQIVSGINYKLIIAAKNEIEAAILPPPPPQLYQSVVFDPASGEMELVSFEKLLA